MILCILSCSVCLIWFTLFHVILFVAIASVCSLWWSLFHLIRLILFFPFNSFPSFWFHLIHFISFSFYLRPLIDMCSVWLSCLPFIRFFFPFDSYFSIYSPFLTDLICSICCYSFFICCNIWLFIPFNGFSSISLYYLTFILFASYISIHHLWLFAPVYLFVQFDVVCSIVYVFQRLSVYTNIYYQIY